MILAKWSLWLFAVTWIVIGVGFLIVPVSWAAALGIALPTATARTDLRATYGGFDLAIGCFAALCALRPEWTRPGLVLMAMVAAGFGGGRLLGMLLEGSASRMMLLFFGVEMALLGLALAALRRV
jgi:hypothetical protein